MIVYPREEWKIRRERAGILKKDIAEYIGCSASQVGRHESNKSTLAQSKLERYKEFILAKEKEQNT